MPLARSAYTSVVALVDPVRIDHLQDAAVGLDELIEEEKHLIVDSAIPSFVAVEDLVRPQLAEAQPLPGKVFRKRDAPRRLEHAVNLCEKDGLIQQPPIGSQGEQLIVGHGAPQEIGQPAGELIGAYRVRRRLVLDRFDPVEEGRRQEAGLHGMKKGGNRGFLLAGSSPGAQDYLFTLRVPVAAPGPLHEALEYLPGPGIIEIRRSSLEAEDLLPGFRVLGEDPQGVVKGLAVFQNRWPGPCQLF